MGGQRGEPDDSSGERDMNGHNQVPWVRMLFAPQVTRYSEYENGAFDPASGFLYPDDGASFSVVTDSTLLDEIELIAAAREDLKRHSRSFKAKDKAGFARDVLAGEDLHDRLADVFRNQPGGFHRVEVEYSDVTVEADGKVGSAANPTVWNSLKGMFRSTLKPCGMVDDVVPVKLIDSVSGVLKPGRLTLVLGPPGAGKSVLLQTLSGRMQKGPHLRINGSIKYNGEVFDDFVVQRTAGYVDQFDRHVPNMTVLETTEFAAKCQIPQENVVHLLAGIKEQIHTLRNRHNRHSRHKKGDVDDGDHAMAELGRSQSKEQDGEFLELLEKAVISGAKPYYVLNRLGLENVLNTFVGDENLRGVSGGEKKRVTTAEVMVGPQWAIFMDEISTGLDSATTFSVVQTLRNACHAFERTVVISLLQPAPEVMELFDDLLLLTDGKVIFHGPVGEALPFFSSLGFDCPPRKDPGSFLQEVTSPIGQLMYASSALLKKHGLTEEDRSFEKLVSNPPSSLMISTKDIHKAFWESTESGKTMMSNLKDHPFSKSQGNPHSLARTQYAKSGIRLSWYAFRRQMLLIKRDKAYYIARCIQAVIMGLICSSFFASVAPPAEPENPADALSSEYLESVYAQGRKVIALIVISIIYLSMSSLPVLGFVFNTKGVFYKHRDNKFFPPWAYAVAQLIAQLPSSTAESILFSLTVYWISGLTRTAGQYFVFLLITWSCSNCLAGVFRLLAYAMPNMVRANALGALILLLLMLTNGFTIIRTSIPSYLIWVYYGLNPLSYGVRALTINELTQPAWGQAGYTIMDSFAIFPDWIWVWMAVVFNWCFLFLITFLGALVLKTVDPPSPVPSVAVDEQKEQTKEGLDRYVKTTPVSSNANENGRSKQKVAVPFDPISIVCRDVKYYVPDPSSGSHPNVIKGSDDKSIEGKLQLLKGISFYAKPGELTALMGGSGAGKTTLMDVVAGRKTIGTIKGDILANGREVDPAVWSRVVGYVEQMDVHSPCITVYETLHFAARLRLSEKDVSDEQVRDLVEDIISIIELGNLRDLVVGFPGADGLSIEQRKRLSIGVELVGNPSVLFMDEPTSGLDARAAAVVMRAVRNVANSDRTVTVTIHQPSTEIFEAFDMLVLLQRGGRLTYFGPLGEHSCSLISYLEGYPGVSPIKPGYNPATWMLEVTGGSMATSFQAADIDFPMEYSQSDLKVKNDDESVSVVRRTLESAAVLTVDSKYATSFYTQVKMTMMKYFAFYWRAPHYNFTRIIMTLTIALIYGLVYLNEGKKLRPGSDSADLGFVQNILGLMFSLAIFNGMFNCMTVMPVIFGERTVFYRQKAASMFNPQALAIAQGAAELPYLALQAIIMVVMVYWMVGFQVSAWKFFYFLLMFLMSVTMYTFLGQMLVIVCPNQLLAQLLAAFLNQMWTIFNGFLVPYPQTPAGWKWMARISPTTWILYGLGATQLADSDVPLDKLGAANITVGEYVQEFWGYNPDFAWWCILIVFAYIAFFRAVTVLALSYVSYNKR
jgi:ABC-type multidrug transport system ATPase subunit/ABC-type multidrug transport system permease subunit